MKIKKLEINKYKRFHKLTINLGENPQRIVALVGPNGCGKSSVFDALLFYNNAHGTLIGKNRAEDGYHSPIRSNKVDHRNIILSFDDNIDLQSKINNLRAEKKERTIFSFRSPFRFNSNLKVTKLESITDIKNNSNGASFTKDLDDKMLENYKRLNIYYNKYLNKNDLRPSEAKMHVVGELNKYIKRCLDLQISNLGDIQSSKGTLFFTKSDQNIEFEFNVLSAGEKEVVDLIIDLYLRREDFNNTIYIIDEPELHINTNIQRRLMKVIDEIIPENCQIWIATHSLGMLRALQQELKNKTQIIEFKKENKWAEQEYILDPTQLNRSDWSRLFSTALDDLTSLVAPKQIIYCEGRDKPSRIGEEKGFDAQVYNNIFLDKYPDTLFVSSGGNTELEQRRNIALKIVSKALKETDILVLKDRDFDSSKRATITDRINFLKESESYIKMLERFEIENYLYDKEILKKYCEVNALQFKEQDYDAIVKDIVNDDVKDLFNNIKSVCNITANIGKVVFCFELSKLITQDMQIYKDLEECIFTLSDNIY